MLCIIFLGKEKRFNEEKVAIYIGFVISLMLSYFIIDDAYHFYRRYHSISGPELMQKYQEKK